MSEVHYFRRKEVEASYAAISGTDALLNYSTDEKWEEISRDEFESSVYADGGFSVDTDRLVDSAGNFVLEVVNLDDSAEIPKVTVRVVPPLFHGRARLIVDQCPYCGEQHDHGISEQEGNSFGLRESHCYPGGQYELIDGAVS